MIERRVIPQQSQDVDNNETETRKGNQIRRHAHGETFDHKIRIEWLENISGEQRMVDARIFVFLQARKSLLSYIYHRGESLSSLEETSRKTNVVRDNWDLWRVFFVI